MNTAQVECPLLLTEREAAKSLRISSKWLSALRRNGQIGYIQAGKSGRVVRYRPADLAAWIAANYREGTRG